MASQNEDGSGKEPTQTDGEVIPGFADVTEYCSKALRSLLLATKISNELPNAGDDFDYYSSFDGFRGVMDFEAKRILDTLQGVMRYHGLKGSIVRNQDATEIEDKFDILVDANDQILERVGTFLDEAAGLRKSETALMITSLTPRHISGSWNQKRPKNALSNYRLLSAKGITRPQLKFKDKVDNTPRPFVPLIKEKYHALRPLPERLLLAQQDNIKIVVDIENDLDFPHPYQYELDHHVHPEHLLRKVTPKQPPDVETTPLTLVEDEVTLNKVLWKLRNEKEMAVDLEHHSYRTFQGLTCLMQVSTRTENFIIDTLALRSQLQILNEVFTDPRILKVFHGADQDIEWLQRDLGLYVVNMFDTGQAARVLRLPRFSLGHLLAAYCNVQADKQYQLADWRIRPLPTELIKYAREDTHYLLYIYDQLRNELLEKSNLNKNLLISVHHRSTQVCAKRYVKPVFTSELYVGLHTRSKKLFNAQQLLALKKLYEWRDRIARQEDESEGYVLPNHMMLQIAELLPKERQGILACCNPIPPILRQSLSEVHAIVMEAREVEISKPMPKLKASPLHPTKRDHPKYKENNPLYSPHDLTHQDKRLQQPYFGVPHSDLMARESSLFTKTWSGCVAPVTAATKAHLGVLAWDVCAMPSRPSTSRLKSDYIRDAFISPYGMFLPKEVMSKSHLPIPHPASSTWKLKANTSRPKPVKVYTPVLKKEDRALIGKEEEERGILSFNQIKHQDTSMRKFRRDNNPNNNPMHPEASMHPEPRIQPEAKAQTSEDWLQEPESRIQKPEIVGDDFPDRKRIQKPEIMGDDFPQPKRKKKDKPTAEVVAKQGAHDYSKDDFALFAVSSAKKKKKKEKKNDYNPATVEITNEHKTPSGPRLNPLTGRRSETFGQTKEAPQSAWPK